MTPIDPGMAEARVTAPAEAAQRSGLRGMRWREGRGEPRLLACDVDGTLLGPSGELRPAVRRAVRAVRDSGAIVVLATGRSPWTVSDIARELDLEGPQITMNGGLYSSPVTGEVAWARLMQPSLVAETVEFAGRLGVRPLFCFRDRHVVVATRGASSPARAGSADHMPEFVTGARLQVVGSLTELTGEGPIRIYIPTGPAVHRRALAAARAWFVPSRASIVWSDELGLEVLAPGTNKGEAVRQVARAIGVGRDEVAAIGDGPNDFEMLAFAGRSAAMTPASEALRLAAGDVVPSCAEDGAVEAMRHFFPSLNLVREAAPDQDETAA